MLKHNNFFIGFWFALLLAALTALLVWVLVPYIYPLFTTGNPSVKLMLIAVIPPVLIMRWYLKALRLERSGMGAVTVVFIVIILYFLLLHGRQFYYFVP